MSRQLSELEALLQQLIAEHRKLLKYVDAHQAAMRVMDLKAMDAAAQQTRVYDEYRATVATSAGDALAYYAVSVVGPRNRVDRIVGRLPLL